MNFNEIQRNLDELQSFNIRDCVENSGALLLNGFHPMRVSSLISVYHCDQDSPIKESDGTIIGWFCPTKHKGKCLIDELTELQQLCLIADAQSIADISISFYFFSSNYVLILKDFLENYRERWKNSSPVWGGFFHVEEALNRSPALEISEFIVLDNLKFHSLAKDMLIDSNCSYSFGDVFLKSYHQIELLTDLIFVKKIKGLDDEIYGFQKLIAEYTSKDLEKLRNAILFLKDDINWINVLDIINNSSSFTQKAEEIFEKYGKDGNPISESRREKFWSDFSTGSVRAEELSKYSGSIKDFNSFIAILIAYWFFRIRCSLAHKRIGEYIFCRQDDEFIVKFGYRLMLEVLKGLFSSTKLHTLLSLPQ